MLDTKTISIDIPFDNEGQILLKCPVCYSFFKVDGSVFGDDSVFEIHCPSCGIVSDNYITDDIIELAKQMGANYTHDLIYETFKRLEKSKKGNVYKFYYKSNYQRRSEQQIMLYADNLTMVEYPCCKRPAKIKPLLILCGSYCPYCGEKYYGIE